MPKSLLANFSFDRGYISAAARERGTDYMAAGSENFFTLGEHQIRGCKGMSLENALLGSRLFFNADNGFAGLGGAADAPFGNVFKVKNLLVFVGLGRVYFNGADLGVNASSSLSYLQKINGVYSLPLLQVGHARPSAPTIFAKSPGAGHTGMNAAISLVIWRVCSITGQTSLYSMPSNVLVLNNETPIVPFPLVDANAQDKWGIGVSRVGAADQAVYYELPTELGGEVSESTLAYTRNIGNATVNNNSNEVNAAGGNFSSADIGRRIAFGAYDSWIKEVVSPTKVLCEAVSAAAVTAAATITHAVNGILRAVEIHWTNESLISQNIAPSKAYPPVAAKFGGMIQDTAFIETAEGIIYQGEPGYLGSFAPSKAMFPNDRAVCYLRASDGVRWRFSEQSLSALSYIGGNSPLDLQIVWENTGIQFPSNACLGFGGRLLAWIGKPAMLSGTREPELEFARDVYPDFAGWHEQTADKPVAVGYDSDLQLEIWAFGKKVMVADAAFSRWCAPLNLAGEITGNIIACPTINKKVKLITYDGAQLRFYHFDAGTGMVCKVKTPNAKSAGESDTLSQINAVLRCNDTDVLIEIFADFEDEEESETDTFNPPDARKMQYYQSRPNVRNAKSHSVQITMTSDGANDVGIDSIATLGETSNVFIP